MSDVFYQERARRRNRRLLIGGGLLAILACAVFGVSSLFYDACTRSFDRSPEAVVRSYVEAVSEGDARLAQECWEHETYYDLEAGCSEICLSRVLGTPWELLDMSVADPQVTDAGRATRLVGVLMRCTATGETLTGDVLLDSIASDVPWRHWTIVHSTVGGTTAEAW